MPRHRRSVYSNSARFDLRVVCLSRAIEYKPVLVVYYWIGIRIGVGVDTGWYRHNMFGGGWIRIEPFSIRLVGTTTVSFITYYNLIMNRIVEEMADRHGSTCKSN
jgi:hypothetical protein